MLCKDNNINFQELRLGLLPHKFSFPPRNKVDAYKATLLPKTVVSDELKTFSLITEVITNTIDSICDLSDNKDVNEVFLTVKYGLDGSGCNEIIHQLSGEADTDNDLKGTTYIGSFWCPLDVKDREGNIVWTNPLSNSILYARIISLVKAKKTRENIKFHFEPTLDELVRIETEPIVTDSGLIIYVKTEISMVDGKMVDLFMGDSGAYCNYYNISRSDANLLSIKYFARKYEYNKDI